MTHVRNSNVTEKMPAVKKHQINQIWIDWAVYVLEINRPLNLKLIFYGFHYSDQIVTMDTQHHIQFILVSRPSLPDNYSL